MKRKLLLAAMCLVLMAVSAWAEGIKGIITDKKSGETLIGVSVLVVGSDKGASTDENGKYEITGLKSGKYRIEARYIFYKNLLSEEIIIKGDDVVLNLSLEPEENELESVFVTAKANRENEAALLSMRKAAPAAIENLGAKEMSIKGLSNVEEGVKKISGISFEENSGQLLVRGLGDRYSSTTLNGLPIASPNPDNKLIPLYLFPSQTVENITVSKVYLASNYADYSGAHIDISTKGTTNTKNLLSLSFSVGGVTGTTFCDFFQSDKRWGLWRANNLSSDIKNMSSRDFSKYILENDPFKTSFSIWENMAIPSFSGSAIFSHSWNVNSKGDQLSLTASISASNKKEKTSDAYISNLTAQGDTLNYFNYDGYTNKLDIAALLNIGYNFRKTDNISYTMFFTRNVSDNFKLRDGEDSEGIHLIGSNSVYHEYYLLNNQLSGYHSLGKKWDANWGISYGSTKSNEPDRRQVMYREDDGTISLFKLNRQETMRYFGELSENELVGDFTSKYHYWKNSVLAIGIGYKTKKRDFTSTRFYYNLQDINPVIQNVLSTDSFLNQENISDGTISILKDSQPKSQYYANSNVASAYAETDIRPLESLLINVGLRWEYSKQSVKYWNDAATEKTSVLSGNDLFPALNIRYNIGDKNTLRFASSRTVTRPSFIEMSPFLYKESYGSSEIRGNENIKNGYNYNIDLRYELTMKDPKDLFSVTAYYKILSHPIEQVQESSGGAVVYTFRNADKGSAMGLEIELKKKILPVLRFSCNASFVFTNVLLPEDGGIYTESERALQGASPYLANADLSYIQPINNKSELALTLMYNLQGPRIFAVGIYGMGNVMQAPLHTLDFSGSYTFDNHWSISLQAENLLGSTMRFTQDVKSTGKTIQVQYYKIGTEIKLGATYNF